MKFSDLFYSRKNTRLLAASFAFIVAAIAVYLMYLDILIPGIPGGSYRLAVGPLFAIPSIILATGQSFLMGFFLHMASSYINPREKDFVKSLFIASAATFLFSLTYAIFPMYGPFYYIVFAVGGPWYALPVEIAWSVATVTAVALLFRKFYGVQLKISYFIAAIGVAAIVVAAS